MEFILVIISKKNSPNEGCHLLKISKILREEYLKMLKDGTFLE